MDWGHQNGTSWRRQAPFEYVRNNRFACSRFGPASVGPANLQMLQTQDAVRQAILARQSCCQSSEQCDAIMMERIMNADPPPRA